MMPQKRNPIALERIRALAGDAAGWGASQLALLHFATSTDADQGYVHNRLPGYCAETAGAIALLSESIATLEIDVDRLAASAGRHWATASALADDLVGAHGLSYREAHEVVARLVTAHENAGAPDGGIRPELAAGKLAGYSGQRLAQLLDPRGFVESRTSAGGTSETRRKELAAAARDDLLDQRRLVDSLADSVTQARARLLGDAAALVNGSAG
jgi:argininosuccinate lyase